MTDADEGEGGGLTSFMSVVLGSVGDDVCPVQCGLFISTAHRPRACEGREGKVEGCQHGRFCAVKGGVMAPVNTGREGGRSREEGGSEREREEKERGRGKRMLLAFCGDQFDQQGSMFIPLHRPTVSLSRHPHSHFSSTSKGKRRRKCKASTSPPTPQNPYHVPTRSAFPLHLLLPPLHTVTRPPDLPDSTCGKTL
ncbi:hypothetical protein E2C01_034912 [Portunus trituberculatus]|uniref:Uncharacterized protein n=1 Tax=Portunus trituberculatus TaxID=210409 RepID=A0A5B7F8A8_PORTR|nr:hypothetical protein [Portunus trituberculatus]